MQRLIIGLSEKVEAEFSHRASERYTLAEAVDDEIYVCRGFNSLDALFRARREYKHTGWALETLF